MRIIGMGYIHIIKVNFRLYCVHINICYFVLSVMLLLMRFYLS